MNFDTERARFRFRECEGALDSLAASYPRQGQVVELRYFAGLSVEETASLLGVSAETVARDWRFAKRFLEREIRHSNEPTGGIIRS